MVDAGDLALLDRDVLDDVILLLSGGDYCRS